MQLAARDGNVKIYSTYQPYRRNPRLSKVSGNCSYIAICSCVICVVGMYTNICKDAATANFHDRRIYMIK